MPDGEAKAKMLTIRLSPEERAAVDHAAQLADKTVSEWVRAVLVQAAKDEVKTSF